MPVVAAAAGAAGLAAYLNAKFHIAHDVRNESLMPKAALYAVTRTRSKRLLNYHVLEEQAARQPDHPFLVSDAAGGSSRRDWTYAQFLADVRKVANWLKNDLGVGLREIVALDGQNTPEYLMLWFGLDAIGAVPSFINCNLTSKPLLHCVTASFGAFCPCRTPCADMAAALPMPVHAVRRRDETVG